MKLITVAIVLCAALYVASAMKLIASSRKHVQRRGSHAFRRLFKRQAHDPYCDRRACAIPNCGKDYVAATLQGDCCERCVPWEYARSIGIPYTHGQPRPQESQSQPQQYHTRAEVYIYGPDGGARVAAGQSIYFDCEVISHQNSYIEPRWSRAGNQPLPYNVQSTNLPGNRKLVRLTVQDATYSEAGRYECSAGNGNSNDQATIDLQVTDGGYYPQPPQPQPQPQPQPSYNQYPGYDPYNQYPNNQPGYYPQPQPEPQPEPEPEPAHNDANKQDGDDGNDEQDSQPAATPAPPAPADAQDDEDEGEYPEDYSENEK